MLDNLSHAVLLFDEHLVVTYLNTAAQMLFAGSEHRLAGSLAKDLFDDCGACIENNLSRCLDTGESLGEYTVSILLLEQAITVNYHMTPLLEGLKPTRILLEIHPIGQHLRISQEEQLMSQLHASRMMMRGLAHEIKNPLGGLRGAAQLLGQELEQSELSEYTHIMIEESDRIQSLVDRMLGPNQPLQKNWFNIHRMLERVRQLVQAEMPGGIAIERDYDPSIPKLKVDQDQLIQAFLNIVRNAAQAIGVQGRITICTRIHRHQTIGSKRYKLVVKIDVIDNGPGIDPGLLSNIFYPMVTGRAEGTGLGLSIAQALIRQHGGLIECHSEPGETVFTIYLPLETHKNE